MSDPRPTDQAKPENPEDRDLGVVEAIVAVRDQCPHAQVRENAVRALEQIKIGGPEALAEQAFLVFSTLSGWRGARGLQVRRSLQRFLAAQESARTDSDRSDSGP